MSDNPRNGGDNVLSFYLGRWISIAIFFVVIVLAAAALFLEPDYPAHVPLKIGVCAFDSTFAAPALESFAARVREQDGGDISWVWLGHGGIPEGCDFYIMTFIQLLSAEKNGSHECVLLASTREDGQLSKGVVIVGKGSEPDWSKVSFTSTLSSTGFISPMSALADNGVLPGDVSFETLCDGCPVCGEAVVIGVILGAFGAGGLSLEELRRIEESGMIAPGSVDVLYTGPGLPEIVLAADAGTEAWKSGGFARRLPEISGNLPGPLRREMKRLGMAVFRPPFEDDLELKREVPDAVWDAAGHHFP